MGAQPPLQEMGERATVFGEVDVPIRFPRGGGTVYRVGLHLGVGF